jgi:hypothetical protein
MAHTSRGPMIDARTNLHPHLVRCSGPQRVIKIIVSPTHTILVGLLKLSSTLFRDHLDKNEFDTTIMINFMAASSF